MPIHFDDLDVVSEAEGLRSALIVPCNLCPAVTVAERAKKPFLQLHKRLMTSAPFERYIGELQTRLRESGVRAEVFKSRLYHQWFMCMWTSRRRRQLQKEAAKYEAVIVLGCDSATETVRGVLESSDVKVIEGMRVAGIMNGRLRIRLPGNVSFDDCKIVPIAGHRVATTGSG